MPLDQFTGKYDYMEMPDSISCISALDIELWGDYIKDEFKNFDKNGEFSHKISNIVHAQIMGIESGLIKTSKLFQRELQYFTSLLLTVWTFGPISEKNKEDIISEFLKNKEASSEDIFKIVSEILLDMEDVRLAIIRELSNVHEKIQLTVFSNAAE